MQATGEFNVQLQPLDPYTTGQQGVVLGRMSIDKTFSGDLVGSSTGEMLTVLTAVEGSAGYVAVEYVSGTLHGRSGAFALQHFGVMHQGTSRLVLEVVPASGSGELATISGQMTINDEGGQHFYIFDYSLDQAGG
jgi:hypothetical protein